MSKRKLSVSVALVVAVVALTLVGRAWGIGFILGQSKDELKLKYDVAVTDHGTGRVSIVFKLENAGRLEPLDNVELTIPAQEKNADGHRWMDLVVAIDMTEADGGKRVGRIHLLKELAERAEIRLNTHSMDGKQDPLTRLLYVIPIAKHLESAPPVNEAPAKVRPTDSGQNPPAAAR